MNFPKFLKNTDKLSLSLYSNPIYKWDGDIFANKNISHSFNYIKDECLYLTFPVYKGSVYCQCNGKKDTIWWISLFWDLSWAWASWASCVEISYLEADNGDLVHSWGQGSFHKPERSSIMITDIMTKMKTVVEFDINCKLQFSFDWIGAWQLCNCVFRWAPPVWRLLVLQS